MRLVVGLGEQIRAAATACLHTQHDPHPNPAKAPNPPCTASRRRTWKYCPISTHMFWARSSASGRDSPTSSSPHATGSQKV